MRNIFLSTVCVFFFQFCFYSGSTQAQSSKNKRDEIGLVEKLKKNHPDQKLVALLSTTEYIFELNPSKSLKNPVMALEKEETKFIALSNNYAFSNAIFYDWQSEVTKLNLKDANGRNQDVNPVYRNYEQDGIFHNDVKVCAYNLSFETRGERRECSYEKRYFDVKYLTSIYFNEYYPIEEKKIVIVVPDWLTLELKEMNFEGFNIEKSHFPDTKNKTTTYTFTAKYLQEIAPVSHGPSAAKYYPHILVLCKKYKTKAGVDVDLFDSVKDLYKWYHTLCEDLKNDPEALRTMVTKLTEGKANDIQKIESIFYWVQENIRYIAFENGIMGFKPESAQNVFKNKYGDCKGKANLIKEMLRVAGFDARLTWIGTTDIPYTYSIPSLAVDNHMICTVFLNKQKYFLDATEDYIAFNDYAHRIQGRPVLIEDGSNFILDKVPEYDCERNKVVTSMQLELDEDILKGNVKSIYNGEEKTQILRAYAAARSDKKENLLTHFISSNDKNIYATDIKTSDLNERQKPLEIKYNVMMKNNVTKVGNELYVNLNLDKEFSHFSIDTTRNQWYEFDSKILIETRAELQIPMGYKIEYLPEKVIRKYPDFSFTMAITLSQDKIIYEKKISIDNAVVRKKDFSIWNSIVKDINVFYNNQVILIKN